MNGKLVTQMKPVTGKQAGMNGAALVSRGGQGQGQGQGQEQGQ